MKESTLRPSNQLPEVYLYRQPVDFRRSYRGLAAIVEQELGHNPFSGTLYVFINRLCCVNFLPAQHSHPVPVFRKPRHRIVLQRTDFARQQKPSDLS